MAAEPEDRTVELLRRWHAGDRAALDELVAETLPCLQSAVRPFLSTQTRRTQESIDFAQSAVVRFLLHGPRFLPKDRAQFHAFLKRIAVL